MLWGTAERPAVVCLGLPVYDTAERAHERAVRKLEMPNRNGVGRLVGKSFRSETQGVIIDQARNDIVDEALSYKDTTHVLFVDSDIIPPPEGLTRLLVNDKPVIGGLYFNRRPPHSPMILRGNHPSRHESEGFLGHVYDYPEDSLYEVDATGCGFLLIQRAVLEAVTTVQEKPFDKIIGLSEDFSFCVRARRKGIKIYVDTGLKLGHIGKIVVDEEFVKRNATVRPREWNSAPKT